MFEKLHLDHYCIKGKTFKEKDSFKVGEKVYHSEYPNEIFTINRIDRHVYPFCLGGGIRCKSKDLIKKE